MVAAPMTDDIRFTLQKAGLFAQQSWGGLQSVVFHRPSSAELCLYFKDSGFAGINRQR